jgi:LuxR family maltose regulon positive regulatory protein
MAQMARLMRVEHLDDGSACAFNVTVGISYLLLNDRDEAARAFRSAFRDGQGPEPAFDHVPRDAASKLALMHAVSGEIGRAAAWLDRSESSPLGEPAIQPFIEASRAAARTLIAVERGDVAAAATQLAGVLAAPQYDDVWMLTMHSYARGALFSDDAARALTVLTSAEVRDRRLRSHPWLAALLLADEIDLNLALNNGTRAQSLVSSALLNEAAVLNARARLALIDGSADAALRDARAVPLAHHSSPYLELQALLIETVALHRLERTGEAVEALGAAINKARSEQAFAAFATVPRAELLAVLAHAPAADIETVLAKMPQTFPAALSSIALTARERVILSYLASGMTLNAIARRETVSINTVKSQYRTLYRKLGATRREDAVRIAQASGLLD